jgi:hypothetical protein
MELAIALMRCWYLLPLFGDFHHIFAVELIKEGFNRMLLGTTASSDPAGAAIGLLLAEVGLENTSTPAAAVFAEVGLENTSTPAAAALVFAELGLENRTISLNLKNEYLGILAALPVSVALPISVALPVSVMSRARAKH